MPATNAITIAFKQTAAGSLRAKDIMDVMRLAWLTVIQSTAVLLQVNN